MNRNHHKVDSSKTRQDLTGEHGIGDAGQIILAFLFAAFWITDSFFLHYTTFLNEYFSQWPRLPLSFFFLILSCYLARTGLAIVFGETREKPTVIRKGVFNWVRHPIYLSEILLYLGMLLISISLAAGVVWLIAIVFLHYISRHEEKLLLACFGEEYEQYMREVPMWIPRLRKK
jgi:protein-S-isoprenylcysteine O-methyltransferase Ste14